MSKGLAIQVSGLGKQYVLGGAEQADQSFREMLMGALASPFRRLKHLQGQDQDGKSFWALRDVSFDIHPGEAVGIIGRNGAGKSTLLKILSRITDPTEGGVAIRGRVSSLLEVGTGFHPELTGRENIFLNGAILGMSRREILSKFDEIVDFAEVEKFLDTPVKRYSSGMYVRLAFAVAAHLEPEILVVDEVLAVGDAEFQKKCLGKMSGVAKEGRTVLFVSHNLSAVRNLCSRALCLKGGEVEIDGEVDAVIEQYMGGNTPSALCYEAEGRPSHPYVKKARVFQEDDSGEGLRIDRPIHIAFDVDFQGSRGLEIGLLIMNAQGVCVHHSCSAFGDVISAQNVCRVECVIPPYGLGSGKHSIDIVTHKRNYQVFEMKENALGFEVVFAGTLSDQTTGPMWKGACGPGLLRWKMIAG